jgi:hypothetical protein
VRRRYAEGFRSVMTWLRATPKRILPSGGTQSSRTAVFVSDMERTGSEPVLDVPVARIVAGLHKRGKSGY